jgi:hypothetical protein
MVRAPDGQNGFGHEGSFECFESGLLSGVPYKGHILLGEVVKRPAYLGEVLDKTSVEIGKPDETSNFFGFRRWCPISNGLYLDRVHGNFAGADDQSEVVNVRLLELTLLGSKVKIVFFETLENFVDDFLMFLESGTPDQNIIQIDCNFAFSNQICKNGIHQCLERGR